MRHAFLALGWFDTSFESFLEGTDVFLLRDGKPARIAQVQDVPADIDGVLFGYMQIPSEGGEEQFVAVSAQYQSLDIRCHSPVRIDMKRHAGGIKAFSPQIRKIDDECASELLSDLAMRNPLLFSALHGIAIEMGWASKPPWILGRSRSLAR
jgi:hypothetical protein